MYRGNTYETIEDKNIKQRLKVKDEDECYFCLKFDVASFREAVELAETYYFSNLLYKISKVKYKRDRVELKDHFILFFLGNKGGEEVQQICQILCSLMRYEISSEDHENIQRLRSGKKIQVKCFSYGAPLYYLEIDL